MKIQANLPFTHNIAAKQPESRHNSALFSQTLTATSSVTDTENSSQVKKLDFTNMTRKDMWDWMNEQIRNGSMSLDESSILLGQCCTIKADGEIIPLESDHERINFLQSVREGIDGALSLNETKSAARLKNALDLMLRQQGLATALDIKA